MIYVGTCGFSEAMKKYFEDFNTIELQQTFYRILDIKLLQKWKKMSKKGFIFNFKAFQGITHPVTSKTWKRSNVDVFNIKDKVGYLKTTKEVFEFWDKMLEYAKILESKVILIQLPESFKSNSENWNNAEKFFRNIERKNFDIGVELRGWEKNDIKKFCKKFNVIDVCDLSLRSPTLVKEISYFRLHGSYKNGRINYYHEYNDKEFLEIKEKFKKIKSKEIFVYFNNVFMLRDSKRFLHFL
jgi:uncharacterized protein YecE (DUF72 family)